MQTSSVEETYTDTDGCFHFAFQPGATIERAVVRHLRDLESLTMGVEDPIPEIGLLGFERFEPDGESVAEVPLEAGGDGAGSAESSSQFRIGPPLSPTEMETLLNYARTRRLLRKERVREGWKKLHELGKTTMGTVARKEILQGLLNDTAYVMDLTRRLVGLGIYVPSRQTLLEMSLMRSVLPMCPDLSWPGHHLGYTRMLGIAPGGAGYRDPFRKGEDIFPWGDEELLGKILDTGFGHLVENASGELPSPVHMILELGNAIVEGGWPAGHHDRLQMLWTDLVSACGTLYRPFWQYAGDALRGLPALVRSF